MTDPQTYRFTNKRVSVLSGDGQTITRVINSPRLQLTLLVSERGRRARPVLFRLDTGADVSSLPVEFVKKEADAKEVIHLSSTTHSYVVPLIPVTFALMELPDHVCESSFSILPERREPPAKEQVQSFLTKLKQTLTGKSRKRAPVGLLSLCDLLPHFEVSMTDYELTLTARTSLA